MSIGFGNNPGTKKFKVRGRKLIVWGQLYKPYPRERLTSSKKRTFKMSKKCKFYIGGVASGYEKVSKKKFLREAKNN